MVYKNRGSYPPRRVMPMRSSIRRVNRIDPIEPIEPSENSEPTPNFPFLEYPNPEFRYNDNSTTNTDPRYLANDLLNQHMNEYEDVEDNDNWVQDSDSNNGPDSGSHPCFGSSHHSFIEPTQTVDEDDFESVDLLSREGLFAPCSIVTKQNRDKFAEVNWTEIADQLKQNSSSFKDELSQFKKEIKESSESANQLIVNAVKETSESANQLIVNAIKETSESANQQMIYVVKESAESVNQQMISVVKESTESAKQQMISAVKESTESAKQQMISAVKESSELANQQMITAVKELHSDLKKTLVEELEKLLKK